MGAERSNSLDAQKRSTGLVAVHGVAKMGVVVAHFMVVGRWCSTSERGKPSPKLNSSQLHIQDGCTNLNWYSTHANYELLVHSDR